MGRRNSLVPGFLTKVPGTFFVLIVPSSFLQMFLKPRHILDNCGNPTETYQPEMFGQPIKPNEHSILVILSSALKSVSYLIFGFAQTSFFGEPEKGNKPLLDNGRKQHFATDARGIRLHIRPDGYSRTALMDADKYKIIIKAVAFFWLHGIYTELLDLDCLRR